MKKDKAVIVFAKFPKPGNVKTRLAENTSENFAVNFYKLTTESLFSELEILNKEKIDIHVFHAPEDNPGKVQNWIHRNFNYESQVGDDLGQRMEEAFRKLFDKSYKKIIIIGADIPDIDADYIKTAFDHLEEHDVVISPSTDGGYNLLGLKKETPSLFADISWSTKNVYSQTLDQLNKLVLNYKELPVLNDIDTEEDLLDWFENSNKTVLKFTVKEVYEKSR